MAPLKFFAFRPVKSLNLLESIYTSLSSFFQSPCLIGPIRLIGQKEILW